MITREKAFEQCLAHFYEEYIPKRDKLEISPIVYKEYNHPKDNRLSKEYLFHIFHSCRNNFLKPDGKFNIKGHYILKSKKYIEFNPSSKKPLKCYDRAKTLRYIFELADDCYTKEEFDSFYV
jgi:hypothetical protein